MHKSKIRKKIQGDNGLGIIAKTISWVVLSILKVQESIDHLLVSNKNKALMEKIAFSCALFIIPFFFFASNAFSENQISPFGGVEWNDGLSEVVKKFQGIGGIEVLRIKLHHESVDVKNASSDNQISEKLSGLVENINPNIFKEESTSSAIQYYTDANGNNKKYLSHGYEFQIIANPVVISSVPFEVNINFKALPGFDIQYPNKVLTESRANLSFPLVIKDIDLRSNAKSLADNYKNINEILEKKYREFDKYDIFSSNPRTGEVGGILSDKNGNSITIGSEESSCFIKYSNGGLEVFEEIYRKHQAGLEANRYKGKADMGSSL